jgi:ArsR family transcriptional regulator
MNAVSLPARRSPLLDELSLLADPTRARILVVLDAAELTVAELCEVVLLPQSTVSRHLKTLADAGWVDARRNGTSRYYGSTVGRLDDHARRLWELVRGELGSTPTADQDRRRLTRVIERRSIASAAFFASAADEWEALRADLFGATSHLRLLPALIDPDAVVADLGCGSGQVALALAPFVERVIGVDASPEMLAVARARTASQPSVELRPGSLEALPIADGAVDVALCVLVLHHLPDPARALAEAARILAPGGRLVVADMLPHEQEQYRRAMGHVWLGFARGEIEAAIAGVGLAAERFCELPAEDGARGPGIFVCTARRAPAASPSDPGGSR